MQHIITDEEASKACHIYEEHDGYKEAMKAALSDFLNNRPQVAQLRPIAEMPETVPEGCFRVFYGRQFSADPDSLWQAKDADQRCNGANPATHFQDIPLPTPDPDAEERRQFEEAIGKVYPHLTFKRHENGSGEYANPHCETSWAAWKLAKKTIAT